MSNKCKWVRLGDYIEELDNRNENLSYGEESVRGVSNTKKIQPTKANMSGRDFSKFHVVGPEEFVFNRRTTRNGERLGLGFNDGLSTYIFTEDYVHFKVNDPNVLLPKFLYLLFMRDEFDRYVRYNSWGSATEFFNWEDMCRVQIPLPSISDQRKVINAWQSLREVKEQNDAIAAPLMQVCQSYMQELKYKYPAVEIGEFIEECNERNVEEKYTLDDVRGLAVSKGMIETKANMDGVSLKSYKIVHPNEIAYVPDTSRRGDKISLGLNTSDKECLVSSISCVFKIVKDEELLPNFLYLLFCRSEFDRYARFNSWGSAREAFSFEDMKRVRIPLPPLSVQQAIVNIYNCANEAKCIAEEADRMSREVCLALIQHVINN